MKTIIATMAGLVAGLALSVGAAGAQQAPKQHDLVGDGYYIDCKGNGPGGYRRCDLHIIEGPNGTVHRFDFNQYSNNRFEFGTVAWGYNGGKDKKTPNMVESPLDKPRFRVVH